MFKRIFEVIVYSFLFTVVNRFTNDYFNNRVKDGKRQAKRDAKRQVKIEREMQDYNAAYNDYYVQYGGQNIQNNQTQPPQYNNIPNYTQPVHPDSDYTLGPREVNNQYGNQVIPPQHAIDTNPVDGLQNMATQFQNMQNQQQYAQPMDNLDSMNQTQQTQQREYY